MIKISVDKVEDGLFIIRADGLHTAFGSIERRPKVPGIGPWRLRMANQHSDHGTYLEARNAAFAYARKLEPTSKVQPAKLEPTPKAQPAKPYVVKGCSRRRDPALRPMRYHLAALACCVASVAGIVATMVGV